MSVPNLYTHQDQNIYKTWFLLFTFLILIIGIGWVASYIYDSPIILYIAIAISILNNIFAYFYSDKIALSISKAKEAPRELYTEYHRLVENLAITAGLKKPRLYIINDPSPNAFATGRNQDHAAIACTTGLLQMMEKSELEGVIAHELAHIGNRDILLQTIVVVLVGLITIFSDIAIRTTFYRDSDNKKHPILLIIGLVLIILSPIIAMMMQLAISRKREYLADATGALLTRYPEGLASALEKLGRYPTGLKKANNATAHMFISSPFGKKSLKGLNHLFSTHPPIEKRVAILRGMDL